MVAMLTHIDPELLQETGMRPLVLRAAEYLQKRVGRSAVDPKSEWKRDRTLGGDLKARVFVSDDGAEAEAEFTVEELEDWYAMKQRLHNLWFNLLRSRFDIYRDRYRTLTAAAAED